MKSKIIAWIFSVLYLVFGFLEIVGDRDENGLKKLLLSLIILWAVYFILKHRNFRFKEVIYFVISLIIPFAVYGSYMFGFLDALV